jgi:hypothetical protein
MHYIIGTDICIKPNPTRGFRSLENQFAVNTVYKLLYISKQTDSIIYTFIDRNKSKVDISFQSCREADAFIAKVRNETIPDYTLRSDIDY